MTDKTSSRMPTFFLSHGGGPWPYMDGDFRRQFDLLEASLKDIPHTLPARVSRPWAEFERLWETAEPLVSTDVLCVIGRASCRERV